MDVQLVVHFVGSTFYISSLFFVTGTVPEVARHLSARREPEKVLAEAAAEALAEIRPHPHRANGSVPEVQALPQALLLQPGMRPSTLDLFMTGSSQQV